jgi:putative membrane protein
MRPVLDSLANGFPWLIFYLLVVTSIYLLGLFIYVKLTPHKELELVQNGNMAAAISFSALVISLALPLAACLINKFSLIDVALWGTLSLFLQLFLFRLTDAIFKGMPQRIENNEVPAATVLAAFKIAGSIILAFAISG